MATPEHITTTIREQQESIKVVIGGNTFEADGIHAIGALGVFCLAAVVIYKKFFNGKRKNGSASPINASGGKPASVDDISRLSEQVKGAVKSLGEGIDANRREIKKVGEGVVRLDERTKGLESDVKGVTSDLKSLRTEHDRLSGKMGNGTHATNGRHPHR